MGADNTKENEVHTTFGNNFSIMVTAGSKEEADRLFNGLSVGGKVWSPMKEEFWGDYMGMLVDKFGISWLVNYELPK